MNNTYLWDEFTSIYWRYKYENINAKLLELLTKIASDKEYVINLNQKALLGCAPVVCILQDYKNEFAKTCINSNKYFYNPLIGAFAAYLVKYHPFSQSLQNNKAEPSNLNGICAPKTVMTFKR